MLSRKQPKSKNSLVSYVIQRTKEGRIEGQTTRKSVFFNFFYPQSAFGYDRAWILGRNVHWERSTPQGRKVIIMKQKNQRKRLYEKKKV